MKRKEIINFPKGTLPEEGLLSLQQRLRNAATDLGPIESLTVVMSPTTAAVLCKARNLRNLRELRDWLGVKAVLTYHEIMFRKVIVWGGDASPSFDEVLEDV